MYQFASPTVCHFANDRYDRDYADGLQAKMRAILAEVKRRDEEGNPLFEDAESMDAARQGLLEFAGS